MFDIRIRNEEVNTGTTNLFSGSNNEGGFGQTQTANAFGIGATSAGSNSVFGAPASGSFGVNQSSGFGSTGSGGAFGKSNQTGNLFNTQSAALSAQPNTGSFSSSSSVFGTATGSSFLAPSSGGFGSQGQQLSTEQSSVYTPIDKLTNDEIEAFKAQTFTAGKIPTKPPPRELCA